MQCMTRAAISFCLYLSSATAMAASSEDGNRASMLYIVLVAGVMIVAVKLVIGFAKKKMEADLEAAKEKSGTKAQDDDSQAIE